VGDSCRRAVGQSDGMVEAAASVPAAAATLRSEAVLSSSAGAVDARMKCEERHGEARGRKGGKVGRRRRESDRRTQADLRATLRSEERECSRSHLSEVRKGRGREGREGGRETGTSTEMRMTRGRRRSAAAATEVATGSAPKAGELTSSWTSISGLRAVTSPVYPRWDKPAEVSSAH
jgi:hypothetical protein